MPSLVQVDPFANYEIITRSNLTLSSSTLAITILLILSLLHVLIILFCIFLISKSCFSKSNQPPWLVKNMYIKDQSGKKVYKSPLLLFNAGIVMSVSQMLCSVAAIAYIVTIIKSSQSLEYGASAKPFSIIGAMFIFENLAHWSMAHCLLVTIISSKIYDAEEKMGVKEWISAPILINTFFIGFFVLVTCATGSVTTWATICRNRLAREVLKVINLLKQGSLTWNQLQNTSQVSNQEEVSQLNSHLLEITIEWKKIQLDLGLQLHKLQRSFRYYQVVQLVIVCTIWMVFVFVFCMLAQKYLRAQRAQRHLRKNYLTTLPRLPRADHFHHEKDTSSGGFHSTMSSKSSHSLVDHDNKRLRFYLLLKALGVLLSMKTQLVKYIICLVKSDAILTSKYWRNVSIWLAIVSGTWSAIPVAFQCWRLYTEEKGVADTTDPPMTTTDRVDLNTTTTTHNNNTISTVKVDSFKQLESEMESKNSEPTTLVHVPLESPPLSHLFLNHQVVLASQSPPEIIHHFVHHHHQKKLRFVEAP